jgi:hypothetical protein
MYIDRIVIARILEIKTSNVRKAWKENETICVQIWKSKEKVYIPIEKYYSFIEELKKNPDFGAIEKTNSSRGNQSNFGALLMVVGVFMLISGYTQETSVSTGYGRVSNISLMNEQERKIQFGGIFFIGGIILYCLDKKDNNSSK